MQWKYVDFETNEKCYISRLDPMFFAEQIMTGEGVSESPRHLNYRHEKQNIFINEINLCLFELIEKEPSRKEQFIGSFVDIFPMFAKQKKSQENENDKDTPIQNKAT